MGIFQKKPKDHYNDDDDDEEDDVDIDEKYKGDYNAPVREYKKFCKKYKFCKGNQITIKVNEMFAVKFKGNYTIPPQYWKDMDKVEKSDEEIKLVEKRSFYPYPDGACGGDTVKIYVFQATKKGKFKVNLTSYAITVKVK